jgi:hypothetical protein
MLELLRRLTARSSGLALVSLVAVAGCTGLVDGELGGQPGSGGAAAAAGGSAGSAGAMVASTPFMPSAPALPRLTTAQYQNVINDLFGPGLDIPELEPDQRPYSFSIIGASTTTVSEHGVDLYSQAAFSIAHAVFADATTRRANTVKCTPQTPLDDACLSSFLQDFGLRAFRRPLTADELTRYSALATSIGRDDPWQALQYVTAALLQSPSFLYRVELGEADTAHPGWKHYTSYEMASRLSFLLRNSFPDADLFASAARGELTDPSGVVAQATRLLDDTGPTETMIRALYAEYLDLPNLDVVKFPDDMDPNHTLGASMRSEVLEIVSRVALRDAADMRTLFTTPNIAVNADLAPIYGLTGTGTDLQPATLPADSARAGVLTTGALLTLNNRPNRTSPTIRGLFIRQRLLCGTVPPPPPGIPPIMEDDSGPPKTIREKLEQHRNNPVCAACHNSMDPIGLGMEDFDQYGRFRTTYDTGQAVDSGGDVDGVMFNGAKQLGALLASDPRTMACLVKQLYRYGSARLETDGEESALTTLDDAFSQNGFKLQPLLLAMVQADGFRYTVEAPQ